MESKAIIIYKSKAYHLSEKTVKEYESGIIHFVDHDGNKTVPQYFGRTGDGFNATFKLTDTQNNA